MTLEQYMRELWLMDKQYGQEEELYPLVNMLLREGANVENLSIRDVHDGVAADTRSGRELLYGYASFPDLVILGEAFVVKEDMSEDEYMEKIYNTNIENIFGCVEMKLLSAPLLNALDIPEKKKDKNYNSEEAGRYVLIKDDNIEKDCAGDIRILISKIEEKFKRGDKGDLLYETKKVTPLGQLLGELMWYGKVLYTNGLVWKYIEIKEIHGDNDTIKNIQEHRKKLSDYYNEEIKEKCKTIKVSLDTGKTYTQIEEEENISGLEAAIKKKEEEKKPQKLDENTKEEVIHNVVKKSTWAATRWLEFLVENNLNIEVETKTIGNLSKIYSGKVERKTSKSEFKKFDQEDYKTWADFRRDLASIQWRDNTKDSQEG